MQILIATWSQQLIQHSYATPISSRLTLNNMDDSRRNRHLYNNSNLSDVVLTFGDERIHAHKDILRSKSEVFVAAFSGKFGEVNEYAVEGHYDAAIRAMIQHIYGFGIAPEYYPNRTTQPTKETRP